MMQLIKPRRLSPDFINNVFFPKYVGENNLRAINAGRCYDWAYYAWCLYPTAELWTTDNHAWIRYGGKFWDSEAPRGVKDYENLGCNSRSGWIAIAPRRSEIGPFKRLWNRIGAGRKHHWELMISEIKRAGLTPIRS